MKKWKDTTRLRVRLAWTWPCDIDLAAIFIDEDGRHCIYHQSPGALASWPFIRLEGDAGDGARSKYRYEQMTVTQLPKQGELLGFLLWDHDAVVKDNASELFTHPDAYWLELCDEYNRITNIRAGVLEGANGVILCGVSHTDEGMDFEQTGTPLRMNTKTNPSEYVGQELERTYAN